MFQRNGFYVRDFKSIFELMPLMIKFKRIKNVMGSNKKS